MINGLWVHRHVDCSSGETNSKISKYEKITEVDIADATLYYAKENAYKKHVKMVIRSDVEEWKDIDAYKL